MLPQLVVAEQFKGLEVRQVAKGIWEPASAGTSEVFGVMSSLQGNLGASAAGSSATNEGLWRFVKPPRVYGSLSSRISEEFGGSSSCQGNLEASADGISGSIKSLEVRQAAEGIWKRPQIGHWSTRQAILGASAAGSSRISREFGGSSSCQGSLGASADGSSRTSENLPQPFEKLLLIAIMSFPMSKPLMPPTLKRVALHSLIVLESYRGFFSPV